MRIAAAPRRAYRMPLVSLVDVLLTLVCFFMLASSYARPQALSLNLAAAAASGPAAPLPQWTLEIRSGEQYRLNGLLLPLAQIEARLRAAAGVQLELQAGAGVPLQSAVTVLERLHPTGAVLSLGRAPASP